MRVGSRTGAHRARSAWRRGRFADRRDHLGAPGGRGAGVVIGQRCGATVAFRRHGTANAEDAVAAYRAAPELEPGGEDADELPPDVQAAILAQLQERHYREWTDVPLPALRGKTPREATRAFASYAPSVVGLLKDFSAESERERKAGRPAYDFSWMWGELGIDPADPLNTRTRPRPVAAGRTIYRLKITLAGTKPPIWRGVLVDGSERLDRLHMILNMAMGWSDGHLHLFSVRKAFFRIPGPRTRLRQRTRRRTNIRCGCTIWGFAHVARFDTSQRFRRRLVAPRHRRTHRRRRVRTNATRPASEAGAHVRPRTWAARGATDESSSTRRNGRLSSDTKRALSIRRRSISTTSTKGCANCPRDGDRWPNADQSGLRLARARTR